MAMEEVIGNLSTTIPSLEAPINNLITLLQIIGGIFGVVVIYWAIMAFINARRIKVLEKMLARLENIDENIAKLAKK